MWYKLIDILLSFDCCHGHNQNHNLQENYHKEKKDQLYVVEKKLPFPLFWLLHGQDQNHGPQADCQRK